jgi:sRNA-binding protein
MNAPANDTPDHTAAAPAEASASEPSGAAPRGQRPNRGRRPQRPAAERPTGPAPARQHPVLDQLATLYPALFGEVFLPLKRGIYQDLLAAQPDTLDKDGLKAALALHTRSTRYLTVVASGLQRHNLAGEPVEDLTPEQVHHALIEVFRRRGARSREDLRPKLRQRILQAYEASGLSRDAYAERVRGRDDEVNQLTQDALSVAATREARDEALLRAFDASGKTLNEFADMYGLHVLDANRTLERARARAKLSRPVTPAAAPAAPEPMSEAAGDEAAVNSDNPSPAP